MLTLGKLCIMAVSTLLMFTIVTSKPVLPAFFTGDLDAVSSPVLPMIATITLSFAVCSYIFEIYQMAVDTILLCFCEDLKLNSKSKHFYAPDTLHKCIDGHANKGFGHFQTVQDHNASHLQALEARYKDKNPKEFEHEKDGEGGEGSAASKHVASPIHVDVKAVEEDESKARS